jgi:hypothetical protein
MVILVAKLKNRVIFGAFDHIVQNGSKRFKMVAWLYPKWLQLGSPATNPLHPNWKGGKFFLLKSFLFSKKL